MHFHPLHDCVLVRRIDAAARASLVETTRAMRKAAWGKSGFRNDHAQ